MGNQYSKVVLYLVVLVTLVHRIYYPLISEHKHPMATQWDGLGYYYFLPAGVIHQDLRQLDWLSEADSTYQLSGGKLYQVMTLPNGNKVGKYFVGASLMQLPFFCVAHVLSKPLGFNSDGFSLIYQYAISFGGLAYFLISLFLLRKVLLRHFEDRVVALTMLLTILATNALQYGAVEPYQIHVPIFFLYVLQLYATQRWHLKPTKRMSFGVGLICGLATLCRPTEAIMFLIPLFWKFDWQHSYRDKWRFISEHRAYLWLAIVGGLTGFAPQFLYWYHVTGAFVFDVGSKWQFLSPFFRVLFGWEKGWFIYTPVTLLFVAGLFFMKGRPFRRSVLIFSLVNIYIIISWFDWRYGASYSTRALVQSYPVWAFALATMIQATIVGFGMRVWLIACVVFSSINVFQVWQYNKTILHYNDNNRLYYSQIFLNPSPDEYDVSLLDTQDWYNGTDTGTILVASEDIRQIDDSNEDVHNVLDTSLARLPRTVLSVNVETTFQKGLGDAQLLVQVSSGDSLIKQTRLRMYSPVVRPGFPNRTGCYVVLPKDISDARIVVSLSAKGPCSTTVGKRVVRMHKLE